MYIFYKHSAYATMKGNKHVQEATRAVRLSHESLLFGCLFHVKFTGNLPVITAVHSTNWEVKGVDAITESL